MKGKDPEQTSIKLLARADDAGLNAETNEGIRQTVAYGIMRNVSVLGVGPALEDAAARLADLDICVGFHACLTSEWAAPCWKPLTGDPSLSDKRGMLPATWNDLQALNPAPERVVRELDAQLTRLRASGLRPVYMDEHMFFSEALPGIKPVLAEFAKNRDLIYRMEIPCLPADEVLDHQPDSLLKQIYARGSGIWLKIAHPAIDSPGMRSICKEGGVPGFMAAERVAEVRLFTHPDVMKALEDNSVPLLRYDELEIKTTKTNAKMGAQLAAVLKPI